MLVRILAIPSLGLACLALAACGGSKSASPPPTTAAAATTSTPAATSTAAPASTSPSALQAEATSKAAGDIPDNQVFLTFKDAGAGYSMKYPEGWAQQGSGPSVTIRDKNNIVRVVVQPGTPPTVASLDRELKALPHAQLKSRPSRITIAGAPAWKATYTTESAPNPVTGKRVTLTVDRYVIPHAGKVAVLDLGTPVGVDNVDAYRMMAQSFRWR